jgi:predicted acyl esterase
LTRHLARLLLAVVTAMLVFVPAGQSAPKKRETAAAAGPPADYSQVKGVTQPTFEKTVKETFDVPMADGRTLYVEVTRPEQMRQNPVILEASPYHGTLADREGTRILPEPRDQDGQSIGLTGYFAPRGYAVVMVDLRGTGRSQGCLDHLGATDASDLKRIVEWAASQEWSNGRVGMTGHSYVGSTPSVAAAQSPEGLETIVPSAGLASMYQHQFQGGVPYLAQWAGPMEAYEQIAIERKLPGGDDFGNNMEETGCGLPNSSLTAGEEQLSGAYSAWHAQRDWEDEATKADIPVFLVHGVNDNAARVAAMEWFSRRRAAGVGEGDKLWLGQWDHGSGCCPTRRGMQWTWALQAWFDQHLAGREVQTGPPVEIFMSDGTFEEARAGDREEVLTAQRWPLPVEELTLYPTADGDLASERPSEEGSVGYSGDPSGAVDQNGTGGAEFATAPLENDMVLAGHPDLDLVASVTAPRVHLIANLLDESPEGDRRRISQFAINPELRHGLATPEPATPGERMTLDPPDFAMGHHLRAGHRLVLRVQSSDPDKVPTFAVDPNINVFTGPEGSALTLPVVEDASVYPDEAPFGEPRPPGPAQASLSGDASPVAPGAGVRQEGLTSAMFEFEVEEADNALMKVLATPAAPADIDLYLQKRMADGGWTADLTSGASSSTEQEELQAENLQPGTYRIEVHNWAGPPGTAVELAIDFFNQAGEKGPDG